MFGLQNFRGSCWVNTAIQAVLRIPEIQKRYDDEDFEKENLIDECLHKIWTTKGKEGLKEFFDSVRTVVMPAGNGIGDAHELFVYLCDKLPFLDKLTRFKIADSVQCISWMNVTIQSVLSIPEVEERYAKKDFKKENVVDGCLHKFWKTDGDEGLKELVQCIRKDEVSAEDARSLLAYLCDKLPFLVPSKIQEFAPCAAKTLKEDTVIEFTLSSNVPNKPIKECISETLEEIIPEWKCETCSKHGCKKQLLIGSFPKVMMFHMVPTRGSVNYPSILSLNKHEYALISVSCFNGGHWWGYGRNMPPGSSWFTLNDRQVQEHGHKQFPISDKMKLLIYYRLEN
jgi:uncharacterized UBP type Zn finger protein